MTYSVTGVQEGVEVGLEGNLLTITPRSAGTHIVTLQVSDGEDAIQYAYRIKVIPIWQAYWWVAALILIVGIFVLWKILHKPRPELERLTEEKSNTISVGNWMPILYCSRKMRRRFRHFLFHE